jgi:hypothetical protein
MQSDVVKENFGETLMGIIALHLFKAILLIASLMI